MIDPDYSFCLQPGEHFKPEVFATVAKAKAMLTVEEKHKIRGMIAERFLQRSRSDRLQRKATIARAMGEDNISAQDREELARAGLPLVGS